MQVRLWLFPREDFAAWQATCCDRDDVPDFATYRRVIEGMAAQARERGHDVELVGITVPDMLRRLEEEGWENNTANRAAVLARARDVFDGRTVLGLKVGPTYIWSALVQMPRLRKGERRGESLAEIEEACSRLLDQFEAEHEAD